MDAGLLKHRVTVMRAVLTPIAGGSYAESYEAFAVGWAAVRMTAAGEAALAGQRLERSRYSITLRARTGLREAGRILWRDHVLRVVAVDECPEDGRYLVFVAEEERGR